MLAFLVLSYPAIDPIAIEIGPLAIRWYSLAYIVGLVLGWQYIRLMSRRGLISLDRQQIDDLLFWIAIGVILGGRIGYSLFYKPDYYLANPSEILMVWRGGMSFHGGLLGVVAAMIWFARRNKLPLLTLADTVAATVPVGLFFGRLANFVNGELFGRATDVAWAMRFPGGGILPRHPSQLYEAGLEGLVLFAILAWLVWRAGGLRRPGTVTGVFLVGYAVARGLVELVREPDAHLGVLNIGLTMGQVLSLPMLAIGLFLIVRAQRRAPAAP
jgi:phosphatidylglycerol:prolipoprotein diacylglycerol transferase